MKGLTIINKIKNKFTKRYLLLGLALLLMILILFLLQQIHITSHDLTYNSDYTNILNKDYTVLRGKIVKKGILGSNNNLYFDITSDSDTIGFFDTEDIGKKLNSISTDKYKIKNIYFNVYYDSSLFKNTYDIKKMNPSISFNANIEDKTARLSMKKEDLSVNISDITDENKILQMYSNMFSYNLLDTVKNKTSSANISLVSNDIGSINANTTSLLGSFQLLQKDTLNLNSDLNDISFKVFVCDSNSPENFIYKSSYWVYSTSSPNVITLTKDVSLDDLSELIQENQ